MYSPDFECGSQEDLLSAVTKHYGFPFHDLASQRSGHCFTKMTYPE